MIRQKLVDLSILNQRPPSEPVAAAMESAPNQVAGIMKRDYPGELLQMALKGEDVHFITGGKWSMFELLNSALPVTGPAQLYLSTYAITELSARTMARHLASGQLTGLHMLVDRRAKVRYPNVHQLASNICTRIRLTAVHAKVMVLHGANATVSVVGSANWTENPRLEAGVITTNPTIAAFHLGWLNTALDNGDVFERID